MAKKYSCHSEKIIYKTTLIVTCHARFRPFICSLYVCGRNFTHFSLVAFLCVMTVVYSIFLAQILCVDLQEFPIMLLEAQLRLCRNCFCCWKSGLRLLSQSYSHRCVMKLIIKRLQIFGWLYSVLRTHVVFLFVLLFFILFYCLQKSCELL